MSVESWAEIDWELWVGFLQRWRWSGEIVVRFELGVAFELDVGFEVDCRRLLCWWTFDWRESLERLVTLLSLGMVRKCKVINCYSSRKIVYFTS